jgi:peptidoglycan/xylan/chitin deacetylase (PgdA/CDA1 family)
MRKIGRVFAAVLALALLAATPAMAASGTTIGVRHSSARSTASPRFSVLAYHAIADLDGDPVLDKFSVAPTRFAEHVDFLRSRGWSFVDLDAVLAALSGEKSLPSRALLLTFDDAYEDLLTDAAPILADRGIPAVAFAVAGQLGQTNTWDSANGASSLKLLDADGLRTATAMGVEIGAHTASHRPLTEVADGELEHELAGAARLLMEAGLPRPRAFSYPFGLWNEGLAQAVSDAGYEVAFTVDRGTAHAGADPCALPRTAVHARDTGRTLHLKLASAAWPAPLRSALRWVGRLGSRA